MEAIVVNPEHVRFTVDQGTLQFCVMMQNGIDAFCWWAPPAVVTEILRMLSI